MLTQTSPLAIRHCLPVNHWRTTQLLIIEGASGRLVVWKIRLAQGVAEIVVLIRSIEDVPNITIEPGLVIRIPSQSPCSPVDQRRFISWTNVLRLTKSTGSTVKVGPLRKFANRHVLNDIFHRYYIEDFRYVRRISA